MYGATKRCFKILITRVLFPLKKKQCFRFKNYLIILKTEKLISPVRPMPKFISDIVSRTCYCVANPYSAVAMMNLLIFHLQSRYDPRTLPVLAATTEQPFKSSVGGYFSGIKQPNLAADRFPPSSYWCLDSHVFEYSVFWDAMLCPGRLVPQEYFETSGTSRLFTKRNITEHVNPQQHHCWNHTCVLIYR